MGNTPGCGCECSRNENRSDGGDHTAFEGEQDEGDHAELVVRGLEERLQMLDCSAWAAGPETDELNRMRTEAIFLVARLREKPQPLSNELKEELEGLLAALGAGEQQPESKCLEA